MAIHIKQQIEHAAQDVAIIGVAFDLPNAQTLEQLDYLLSNGIDCVQTIPWNRLQNIQHTQINQQNSLIPAAYLDKIDTFDYPFFGISPNEAKLIDPAQRLYLQVVCRCIQDAGYSLDSFKHSLTGVYTGYSMESEYKHYIEKISTIQSSFSMPGNITSVLSGRISHFLDLKGPSLVINTACSSSLTAVHIACRDLNSGDSDIAIAGGVRINVFPYIKERLGIESTDGKTRVFDQNTTGMGGGEGVIAVLLKPIKKALASGDHIYAIIKGSAYNQDGATMSISTPSAAAQAQCMLKAWTKANVNPETITYIETHGTGTHLGDCIEVRGLTKAFYMHTKKRQFCAIGSIKSNIGHLDAAAGMAGLLKCILSLKNKKLYPNIHFECPNEQIDFIDSPVYPNTILQEWNPPAGRRCGVSSFGFSGTNCHIVLEEAPVFTPKELNSTKYLLLLSAMNQHVLRNLVQQYIEFDFSSVNLDDVCYTAASRDHYCCRLAITFISAEDLKKQLTSYLNNEHKANCNENIYTGYLDKKNMHNTSWPYKEALSISDLAGLYCSGVNVWEFMYNGQNRHRVSLPSYPFQSLRCWAEPEIPAADTYITKWIEQPCNANEQGNIKSCIIIIQKLSEKARQIVAAIKSFENRVIEATYGTVFAQTHDGYYSITDCETDYSRLFQEADQFAFKQVIYIDVSDHPTQQPSAPDTKSIFSLFSLIKSLVLTISRPIEFTVISSQVYCTAQNDNLSNASMNAAFAFVNNCALDYPHLSCRCIDIDFETPVIRILQELDTAPQKSPVVFRSGIRYIEQLCPLTKNNAEQQIKYDSSGVYVIAGGAGAMGLIIARHLLEHGAQKIALLNRTSLPQRSEWNHIILKNNDKNLTNRLKEIISLENAGADITYMPIDITQWSQLDQAFSQLRKKYKSIRGVINSAGTGVGMHGKKLHDWTETALHQVMDNKIIGTWNLHKVTENDELDLFVLFSSPITLTGSSGSAGYVAANAFESAFVQTPDHFQTARMVALSWAPWDYTFFKTQTEYNAQKNLFQTLCTQQITQAFGRLCRQAGSNIIIGTINNDSKLFEIEEALPFTFADKIKEDLPDMNAKQNASLACFVPTHGREITLCGSENITKTQQSLAKIYGNILGYDNLDQKDSFFELGGDSIIAVKVVEEINRCFDIELRITQLLKMPVIQDLAQYIDSMQEKKEDPSPQAEPPQTESNDNCYVASWSQKRLYMLHHFEKEYTAWNITYAMKIEGSLDKHKLKNAFKKLVLRHEILRTAFRIQNGEVMQIIHSDVPVKIQYIQTDQLMDVVEYESTHPFSLENLPLFRIHIVIQKAQQHLLFSIHHIISDEISMDTLLDELTELYQDKPLTQAIQYKEYSQNQHNQSQSLAYQKFKEHWLNILGPRPEPIIFPTNTVPPPSQNYPFNAGILTFQLSREQTNQLKKLSYHWELTEYWLHLSVFSFMLHCCTQQKKILIGLPMNGRAQDSMTHALGLYTSFFPFYMDFSDITFFDAYLNKVKLYMHDIYQYCEFPFDMLLEDVYFDSKPTRIDDLFTVYFQMHKKLFRPIILDPTLSLTPIHHQRKLVRQDLLVDCYILNERFHCDFIYNKQKLHPNFVEWTKTTYIKLLCRIVQNPAVSLQDLKNSVIATRLIPSK